MLKNVFHNRTLSDDNFEKKNFSRVIKKSQREIVDINKLLNRIKINKYNEKKNQIIFYSSVILLLIVVGTFISIIR